MATNRGNNNASEILKRIQPGKPVDQLLNSLSYTLEDEDSQYFEKVSVRGGSIQGGENIRGAYSAVSYNIDQSSSYHMDLLEEKREEIQNIIRKRQRKAAFNQILRQNEGQGKATMTNYVGRRNS